MAASMTVVGAVPASSRVSTQKPCNRASRAVCLATRREAWSSDNQSPLLSAAVAATVAGALALVDVQSAQADQGDVYEQLGIPPPTGESGVVVESSKKQTPFQSGTPQRSESAPKPARTPAPASAPVPPPAPAPAPAPVKKSVPKPKVEKKTAPKKVEKPKKAVVKETAPKPLKLSAVRTSEQGAALEGVELPSPSAGQGKLTLTKPKTKKAFQSGPKEPKAKAPPAEFTFPKFELPSFSAPSVSAPSISLPAGSANDTQQALAVAGIEVVLVLIASSVVGGLASKRS